MPEYFGRQAVRENAYAAMRDADPLKHARDFLHLINDHAPWHDIPETYRSSMASRLPK